MWRHHFCLKLIFCLRLETEISKEKKRLFCFLDTDFLKTTNISWMITIRPKWTGVDMYKFLCIPVNAQMNLRASTYYRGVRGLAPQKESWFLDSLWRVLGVFSTTVSVHYFTKLSLDLHDFFSVWLTFSNQGVLTPNLSNQGARMKIKESENLKKSFW